MKILGAIILYPLALAVLWVALLTLAAGMLVSAASDRRSA